MASLSPGSVITTSSDSELTVHRYLGEGGQGTVWEVVTQDGERRALKWYFPHMGTEAQQQMIADLIDRGPPNDRFLWPLDLVTVADRGSFGYLMKLRPGQYRGLAELVKGLVDPPLSSIAALGMDLVSSFLDLHAQGLCYRDISFGNVFFNPSTARPLICDTDNIGVDGSSRSPVLGTRRFMAPEIVRREAVPSIRTDLHSLAVLLFYILMLDHPLVGRRSDDFECWDDRAESVLLGETPLFIFDPADESNRPSSRQGGVTSTWGSITDELRELFVRTFTSGLADPTARVRESRWRVALSRMRNAIMNCPHCGLENVYQPALEDRRCWSCAKQLGTPVRVIIDQDEIVLNQGSRLFRHHLRGDYDYETPVGEVMRHPEREDVWGLRNVSGRNWVSTSSNGSTTVVEDGQAVAITQGLVVEFGEKKGTVTSLPPA